MSIWLAARSLQKGHFRWPSPGGTAKQLLLREQLEEALVPCLPWRRLGEADAITILDASAIKGVMCQ
nr:hypothetical protein [uncultured Albidiferax sp.]